MIEEAAQELQLLLLESSLAGLAGEQNHAHRPARRRQKRRELHADSAQGRTERLYLGRQQAQRRELFQPHQRTLALELVVEDADDGQFLGQGVGSRLTDEPPVRHQVEGRKVQTQELGQPINELRHNRTDLDLPGKGLPHLHHRSLQLQPFSKEKPVDRALETLPERLEEEHDGEGKDHRKIGRRRELGSAEEEIERRDAESIDSGHHGGGHRVEQALAQDHADVEETETNDRVGEGDRHQDQRYDAVEEESLGVEEGREADSEHNEGRHTEQGPYEDQPRAPPLGRIREVASGEVEGAKAQHHVADHHPPVGHRRATDQSQRVARVPSPQVRSEVDHRRQQVERQHLGADAGDPA